METLKITEDGNIRSLVNERNRHLPSMISSLNDINNLKLLENVGSCLKYIPTYSVSEAVEQLLQYITPVIRQSLKKIYDDNLLLSDTVDDDIVINILKEKLQIAIDFIRYIKTILNFLTEHGEINFIDLNNIPIDLADMIFFTFQHCKNCGDEYKATFNTELLEIFRLTQDVHALFLKLFESFVVVSNVSDNNEIGELKKVLEIICNMNEVLSEISIKSMSDNWKGYVAIMQKFSTLLGNTLDLTLPVQSLTALISKHLNSLCGQDEVESTIFVQVVKIAGFLIKVALKIFDIFWNYLENIGQELLTLCCTVYSYGLELLCAEKHSSDCTTVVESALYKPLEPFLLRLIIDPLFVKVFNFRETVPSDYRIGFIIFLNNILHLVVISEHRPENFDIIRIIGALFNSTKQCYAEFFRNSSTASLFDELVSNITASVLIYGDYPRTEYILLENIFQEHIWNALLAIDVWTLLLHNSTPQLRLDTLLNIIKKYPEIDFGIHTNRPEKIYLKCLIQRIFCMPYYMKNDIITKYNPRKNINIWNIIGFQHFPVQNKSIIEDICEDVINKLETLERDTYTMNSFISTMESLELLSTANFNQLGVNPTRLMKAVCSLWEFNCNHNLNNNSAFKYFITRLCRITNTFITDLSSKELITILTRLKFIANDDSYKLGICESLFWLGKRSSRYNQDEGKIKTLVSSMIYPSLLGTKNRVIKQRTLEVIHNFTINGKHEIVENVTSNEIQREISNYLERNVSPFRFDKTSLTKLGSFEFQHECISWKTDVLQPLSKKRKIDELTLSEGQKNMKEKEIKNNEINKAVLKISESQINDEGNENISEVINTIKGDVKCLLNVLKTEKLSRKNASDIKLIANQLLSFL